MEQSIKIYDCSELSAMPHEAIVAAYCLLASSEKEHVTIITQMKADYALLAKEKKEADAVIAKLAKMLPSILTQLERLETRIFGKQSKSYSSVINKNIKYKELFDLMQSIKDRLLSMNNGKSEEKKEAKKNYEGDIEEEKEEEKKEEKKKEKQPDNGNEVKKQESHMDGNPHLSHIAKELSEFAGGSLDHMIVMVDPIFRTEDELRRSIGVTTDLSNVSILSDAEFYFSLEYVLGYVYPCLHVSVKLKSNGKTIRNSHHATIADQCLCSPSLGGMLLAKRFNLALPTARSESHEFPYMGLTISRSKAYDWMNLCAERYLKYINAVMMEKMLDREVLLFDETYGKTREAGRYYYWDCRTSENEDLEQLISFFYSRSHSAVIAKFLTHGFHGYLCADGLDAYEIVACVEAGIKLCNCWNHVRTYLSEAFPGKGAMEKLKNGNSYMDFVLLEECIKLIGEMFHLDTLYKKEDKATYEKIRLTEILPHAKHVIENLKKIKKRNVEYQYNCVLKDAVDYVLTREENLLRFAEDIRIPLSTNSLETQHTMVAIGRNNFFLYDTENGARTGSHCYAVTAKARLDNAPVQDYFEFLLEFLPVVLEMHMAEVLRYDEYEEKALALVSDALEWQKKHPGKRAALDFGSLGERPSLKFLEPYLCGTNDCLFDKWLLAKKAYREKILAQNAQNISKANLEESGLPEDVLKRIVTCGLKSQTLKESVKVGLERMEQCLENLQVDIDSGAKSKIKFHPAYVYETTQGQDSSVSPKGDCLDPDQSKSKDGQEGSHNETKNDDVSSDTGSQGNETLEGRPSKSEPDSPVQGTPDSLDDPGSSGSSVQTGAGANEAESVGQRGGNDGGPDNESHEPDAGLPEGISLAGGAGNSEPGSPVQGTPDSLDNPGSSKSSDDANLSGDVSLPESAGSSEPDSMEHGTRVALSVAEKSAYDEAWPESQDDCCVEAASPTVRNARGDRCNMKKAEHCGKEKPRGKAPP